MLQTKYCFFRLNDRTSKYANDEIIWKEKQEQVSERMLQFLQPTVLLICIHGI